MAEFPDFVPKYIEDADSVRARFDSDADPDVDKRVGSFYHVTTDPSTREFSRLWDILNDVIASRSYLYATGIYLDYIAAGYGLTRKAATKATGSVTVTGTNGTVIPSGTRFSTTALDEDDTPIRVISTASGTIASGTVTVTAEADIVGVDGNVSIAAINLLEDSINGVASVTNAASFASGTDQEDDEDLRLRIAAVATSTQGAGNIDAYKKWAQSIDGVGPNVTVLPVWAGANTVKVIVLDPNNGVASQAVLDTLQEYLTGAPKLTNPLTAPVAAAGAAGLLTGTFTYKVTFSDANTTQKAETKGSPASNAVVVSAKQIGLTGIPLGPTGTLSRDIYRSSGGAYQWVDTIADNTTTTYTDNLATPGTKVLAKVNNTTNFTGVAPVGALVTVDTPSVIAINVAATVAFETGYSLDGAGGTTATRAAIEAAIHEYIDTLPPGGDVIYNHVLAQFFKVTGVFNVSGATINSGTSNIAISDSEVADTGTLTGIV